MGYGTFSPAACISIKQHPSLRLQLAFQMFKGLICKNNNNKKSQENNYSFISIKHFVRRRSCVSSPPLIKEFTITGVAGERE